MAILSPDLRVTEMNHLGLRRGVDDGAVFNETDTVGTSGQALHLTDKTLVAHVTQPCVPGVDQRQGVATHHCTAGKTTVPVEVITGGQGNGQVLPMDQIGTLCMAPVHRAPFRVERVVLIEHMIFATKEHHPVGVIHPACRRRQVVTGPIIVDELRQALFQRMVRAFEGGGHRVAHGIHGKTHRVPACTRCGVVPGVRC